MMPHGAPTRPASRWRAPSDFVLLPHAPSTALGPPGPVFSAAQAEVEGGLLSDARDSLERFWARLLEEDSAWYAQKTLEVAADREEGCLFAVGGELSADGGALSDGGTEGGAASGGETGDERCAGGAGAAAESEEQDNDGAAAEGEDKKGDGDAKGDKKDAGGSPVQSPARQRQRVA
jgi:hypothetical protein